jgi:Lhr-like helicase
MVKSILEKEFAMSRLMAMIAGAAALCGMTAFGYTGSSTATTATASGETEELEQHAVRTAHEFAIIHRALAEGMHDATTLQLVSQALTDRTTLLESELNRVSKLQALVTAIQGGNRTAIQEARQAVRTATQTVVANANTFSQDCRAIRERLQSLPHTGHRESPQSGGANATTNE